MKKKSGNVNLEKIDAYVLSVADARKLERIKKELATEEAPKPSSKRPKQFDKSNIKCYACGNFDG